MIVKELILKHEWNDIERTYEENTPDYSITKGDGSKFSNLYEKLRCTDIASLKYPTYIEVSKVKNIIGKATRSDVTFSLDGMPILTCLGYTEINKIKENVAVEFSSWGEILGLTISPKSLKKYSEAQIIATVIDLVTYFGYNDGDGERANDEINGKREFVLDMYLN